ncbi:MAG TPA: hypothetical protein VHG92_07275 [Afifellaceae bacterium]|nr:hypothetical protein [Afifellaceae bacterium]
MLSRLVLLAAIAVPAGVGAMAMWSAGPAPEPIPQTKSAEASEANGRPGLAEDEIHHLLSFAPRIGEIVPPASRDVTPPGFTPGPPITGPLVRVPSPVPRKPRAKPPPRTLRLVNPEIASAGILLTSAGRVAIAGIAAPAVEETCGSGDLAWTCGVVARAELRRLIRGRAIECQVPFGASELPQMTACTVAGRDLGEWLVRQGWALPTGTAYAREAEEAKAARRGLWGSGRRGNSVCFTNC